MLLAPFSVYLVDAALGATFTPTEFLIIAFIGCVVFTIIGQTLMSLVHYYFLTRAEAALLRAQARLPAICRSWVMARVPVAANQHVRIWLRLRCLSRLRIVGVYSSRGFGQHPDPHHTDINGCDALGRDIRAALRAELGRAGAAVFCIFFLRRDQEFTVRAGSNHEIIAARQALRHSASDKMAFEILSDPGGRITKDRQR